MQRGHDLELLCAQVTDRRRRMGVVGEIITDDPESTGHATMQDNENKVWNIGLFRCELGFHYAKILQL